MAANGTSQPNPFGRARRRHALPAPESSRRKTWPYAVTAVLVYALNEGWSAADVIKLAAVLLVLVALVVQAGSGGEQ